MNYLTENNLEEVLSKLYPNVKFNRGRTIPNSDLKNKPDYSNNELKLIIEYDGPRHYTESNTIIRDELKDKKYQEMGYKIFRLNYFMEIPDSLIENYFNIKTVKLNWEYPSGFIHPDVILPADFCELGIERFKRDLEIFWYLKDDIINSLKKKIEIKGNIRLVLPPSLNYLIK